jgi:hypothetical protein
MTATARIVHPNRTADGAFHQADAGGELAVSPKLNMRRAAGKLAILLIEVGLTYT